ncbi:hypothetical protein QTL86_12770 [Cellulosilyticum sp. ST5]|uniref:hypothetical protein n=1 Tax=Cellulosilyticum sp. ST5 TaxID=3055805 RepID=UPI0039777CEC
MRLRNLKPYKLNKAKYKPDDERNQILDGYEEIATINADIQPCSGQLKAQLYGKELTKYLTVYMFPNTYIEEGLFILVDNKYYEVQVIEKWDRHYRFDIKVVS